MAGTIMLRWRHYGYLISIILYALIDHYIRKRPFDGDGIECDPTNTLRKDQFQSMTSRAFRRLYVTG